MIRNDTQPAQREGYEPTGEGFYATCPDHGSRLWWHHERHTFYCPAEDPRTGVSLHAGEPYEIAPADVYLEHDEAFRVVNGCLWVDKYDDVTGEE